MADPLIDLRDVSRVYRRGADDVHALEHVSLTIEGGLFVALMGPSGSGKSTLLNLLSGIDRPSGGDVVVAGKRLNDLSEDELARWRSRHVGLIFQFYNLIPVLSALENVELPLLLTSLDRRERLQRARDGARRRRPRGPRASRACRALGRRAAAGRDRARDRHRPRSHRRRRADRRPRREERRRDPADATASSRTSCRRPS